MKNHQESIIEIVKDCQCESDKHEAINYPRKGQTIQDFKVGDRMELIENWSNCYGTYFRVKTDKGHADISTVNAEITSQQQVQS